MDKELVEKIRKAVLQMMEEVSFDEKKHIYTRKSDGAWLQGTSTVSNVIPKGWLSAWGAKECVKALGFSDYEETEIAEDMLAKIKKMELEEYLKLLKHVKGSAFRKKKDAMADGTEGHEWIEMWVKAKIREEELPALPEGMLERPCKQFVEWSNENVDYWILSEARVVSVNEKYAGTMDGLAMMKDGKLAVIDFKFATKISEDAYLQTAGYQNCFEKYGIKVDERIIIRLPKTLETDEYDKKTRTYSRVPNNLEVRTLTKGYEFDRDTFLHCLPVKQWINLQENK